MPETQKSAWGRMRSGGGARKLVLLSLGGGLAAAVGLAAAGVFRDLLLALGVGAALLSILQITTGLALQWPLSLVLAGVLILAVADFGIRFQLAKRAES